MLVSGEYIITYDFKNHSQTVGHGDCSYSAEAVTSFQFNKWLKDNVKLPDNATYYIITGIYKL